MCTIPIISPSHPQSPRSRLPNALRSCRKHRSRSTSTGSVAVGRRSAANFSATDTALPGSLPWDLPRLGNFEMFLYSFSWGCYDVLTCLFSSFLRDVVDVRNPTPDGPRKLPKWIGNVSSISNDLLNSAVYLWCSICYRQGIWKHTELHLISWRS